MPSCCCAIGCTNRQIKGTNKRFFRIPMSNQDRLVKWIIAIRRANWQPNEGTRICSDHFISGEPSKDPLDPDFIPTIFSFNLARRTPLARKKLQKRSVWRRLCCEQQVHKKAEKSELEGQCVEELHVSTNKKVDLGVLEEANSAPDQTSQTHAYIQELLLKKYNAIPDEYGMFFAIEKYASTTRNARIKFEVHEDRYAAVLVTNFMHRIHKEFRKTCEVVFVDTACTDDNCHNVAVTSVLCAGPVGAAPLGVVFTSSQEEISFTSGFLLLKKVLNQDGFFGKGHPRCFITPNCKARQKALKAVWPQSSVYCNISQVLREVWNWLCTTPHGIGKEYLSHLMMTAKKLVYADNESTFQLLWDTFWQSSESLSYIVYTSYLRKVMERRHDWGLGQRAESKVPGDQADSRAESAMCITKDIIQNRCKNFNAYQLITFMNEDYDMYMKQLLLDAALGQQQTKTLVNYSFPLIDITQEDSLIFKVRNLSPHEEMYNVDLMARICDCSDDQTEAVCKHQLACSERHLLQAPLTYASAPEYKFWLASIAHGIELSEMESYTKLQNLPAQVGIFENPSTSLQDKCVANEVHYANSDNYHSDSLETSPSTTKKSIDFFQFIETFQQLMRDYADNRTHEFLTVCIKRLRTVRSTKELNSFLSSALASIKDEMGDMAPVNENQFSVYTDVAQEPGDLAKRRLSTSDNEKFPNFSGRRKCIKKDEKDRANSSSTKKWEFVEIKEEPDALQSVGEDKDAFQSDVVQEMDGIDIVLVKQEHDIDDGDFSGDC